jgi:hypothetical protein
MRFSPVLRSGVLTAAVLFGACSLYGQAPAPTTPDALTNKAKGVPPRVSAAEYQAHAEAGTVTIGAEFVGHSVPTPDGTFTTEDYVVVEVGFFGAPDTKVNLSPTDFSLRINGNKKGPLPSQPFEVVAHSLKDPEWSPPPVDKDDSKGSGINTGGKPNPQDGKPPPPRMPMPLVLAMDQKVQKARLPEGERALPQAGLLFFQYHGKEKDIHSLELIYSGAAGKATLTLQ